MSVYGQWEDVMETATPAVRECAEVVRRLIAELHPGAVEVARPGERSVCFGFGGRKMRESYAYVMPHARWLNLGFFQGARLPDPEGLLEGTGKALRHVKLRDRATVDRAALRSLIAAAISERAQALEHAEEDAR